MTRSEVEEFDQPPGLGLRRSAIWTQLASQFVTWYIYIHAAVRVTHCNWMPEAAVMLNPEREAVVNVTLRSAIESAEAA